MAAPPRALDPKGDEPPETDGADLTAAILRTLPEAARADTAWRRRVEGWLDAIDARESPEASIRIGAVEPYSGGRMMLERAPAALGREIAAALEVSWPAAAERLVDCAAELRLPVIVGWDTGGAPTAKLYLNASDAGVELRRAARTRLGVPAPWAEPHVLGLNLRADSHDTKAYLQAQTAGALARDGFPWPESLPWGTAEATSAGAVACVELAGGRWAPRAAFVAFRSDRADEARRYVLSLTGASPAAIERAFPFRPGPLRQLGAPATGRGYTLYAKREEARAPLVALDPVAVYGIGACEVGLFVEPRSARGPALAHTRSSGVSVRDRRGRPPAALVRELVAWARDRIAAAEEGSGSCDLRGAPPPWVTIEAPAALSVAPAGASLGRASRTAALVARFAPRTAEGDPAPLRELVSRLEALHAADSDEELAARVVAEAGDLLAPALARPPAPASALASPFLGLEHRLARLRAARAHLPPEFLDGPSVRWAPSRLARADVLAWWLEYLASPAREWVRHLAYVHVPFCRTKCSFCQFDSTVELAAGAAESFLEAIGAEARELAACLGGPLRVDAATIGGGTPSALEPGELARLLESVVGSTFRLDDSSYFSVELNPDSATPEKVRLLRAFGVNRISLGVQSLEPEVLRRVARGYQTDAQVGHAVEAVRAAGDLQLSVDLLAPLPGETLQTFAAGVARILTLGPDQIVLYPYQPVTRGERTVAPGAMPWGEASRRFVELASDRGYEVVPHTGATVVAQLPGARTYPVRYVQHPYEPTTILGLGPFAESYVFGVGRYVASAALDEARPYRGERVDLTSERSAYLGRSLAAGRAIDEPTIARVFGSPLASTHPAELAYLAQRGNLARSGDSLALGAAARAEVEEAAWLLLDEPARAVAEARRARARGWSPNLERERQWLAAVDAEQARSLDSSLRASSSARGGAAIGALVERAGPPRLALAVELCAHAAIEASSPAALEALLRDALGPGAERAAAELAALLRARALSPPTLVVVARPAAAQEPAPAAAATDPARARELLLVLPLITRSRGVLELLAAACEITPPRLTAPAWDRVARVEVLRDARGLELVAVWQVAEAEARARHHELSRRLPPALATLLQEGAPTRWRRGLGREEASLSIALGPSGTGERGSPTAHEPFALRIPVEGGSLAIGLAHVHRTRLGAGPPAWDAFG